MTSWQEKIPVKIFLMNVTPDRGELVNWIQQNEQSAEPAQDEHDKFNECVRGRQLSEDEEQAHQTNEDEE